MLQLHACLLQKESPPRRRRGGRVVIIAIARNQLARVRAAGGDPRTAPSLDLGGRVVLIPAIHVKNVGCVGSRSIRRNAQ